jgi:hypothetical protein
MVAKPASGPRHENEFGTFNAKYDDLTALDQWVDGTHARDVLIAVDENTEHSGRTRPMCAYQTLLTR